jgi:hypothetical protein
MKFIETTLLVGFDFTILKSVMMEIKSEERAGKECERVSGYTHTLIYRGEIEIITQKEMLVIVKMVFLVKKRVVAAGQFQILYGCLLFE